MLPEGHPDAGWPQVFDPLAGYQYMLDKERAEEQRSTRRASTGLIELYQTAQVVEATLGPTATYTVCLQPLVYVSDRESRVLAEPYCGYRVPNTSLGGTVRFGHHPDSVLRDAAAPEVEVVGVPNRFYGNSVTVAGLMGGQDLRRALLQLPPVPRRTVVLSPRVINSDGLTLDGMRLDDIAADQPHAVVLGEEDGFIDFWRDLG